MGRNGNTPVWTKDVLQMKTIKDVANVFGELKSCATHLWVATKSFGNPGLPDLFNAFSVELLKCHGACSSHYAL